MAWTTPRTWTTGEIVTAAMLNEQVRDNENELRRGPSVKAKLASAFNVGSGAVDTVINWDGEEFDTDTMHDTVTNNSRLTIPTGMSGYWDVGFSLNRSSGTGTFKSLKIRKNGTTVVDQFAVAGAESLISYSAFCRITINAGDYLELLISEASGASLNIGTTSFFEAAFVGGP